MATRVVTEPVLLRASPGPASSSTSLPWATKTQIPLALVGAGKKAQDVWAPKIFQSSDFVLRALWSRTRESAERFNLEVAGNSLEVFCGEEGFKELLARDEIEGFVVALPPSALPAYVVEIVSRERHLLSDKPFGAAASEAEVLQRFGEQWSGNMVWFMSDSLRYELAFAPPRLRVADLGHIVAAELCAVAVVERCSQVWDSQAAEVIAEGFSQYVGLMQQLLGRITEVNCDRRVNLHRASSSTCNSAVAGFRGDAVCGTLKFEAGPVCVVNWRVSAERSAERFRLTLLGSQGTVMVELDEGREACDQGIRRYCVKRSARRDDPPMQEVFTSDGLERQLEAWAAAIRAVSPWQADGESSQNGQWYNDPAAFADQSPLRAFLDLMVMCAVLQSSGTPVVLP